MNFQACYIRISYAQSMFSKTIKKSKHYNYGGYHHLTSLNSAPLYNYSTRNMPSWSFSLHIFANRVETIILRRIVLLRLLPSVPPAKPGANSCTVVYVSVTNISQWGKWFLRVFCKICDGHTKSHLWLFQIHFRWF